MADNLLQCSNCKTLNRVPSALSSGVNCGSCGNTLISIPITKRASGVNFFLVGAVCGVFGTLYSIPRTASIQLGQIDAKPVESVSNVQSTARESTDLGLPDFPGEDVLTDEEVGFVRPETGTLIAPLGKRIAPFQVRVSSDADYYVCLISRNGNLVASYYIRAGDTLDVSVPLGTFELVYAAGKTWFGSDKVFGDGTTYSNSRQHIEFSRQGGRIKGVVVELILQQNGNFPTEEISREEFIRKIRG